MKKLLGVVIILCIAILMALTVPDIEEHKKAMMKAIAEYVDEEATNMGIPDNDITRLGKKTVTKTIEHILSSKLKEDNYVIFNTTHIVMEEENKLLSLGMFGHVFTFNKDMLREALEKKAEEKAEAKAEKKRKKAEAKAEKKRKREEAKAEKKRLKEEKKRKKEAEKAEKEREKEAAKAEKERLKAEEKAKKAASMGN